MGISKQKSFLNVLSSGYMLCHDQVATVEASQILLGGYLK